MDRTGAVNLITTWDDDEDDGEIIGANWMDPRSLFARRTVPFRGIGTSRRSVVQSRPAVIDHRGGRAVALSPRSPFNQFHPSQMVPHPDDAAQYAEDGGDGGDGGCDGDCGGGDDGGYDGDDMGTVTSGWLDDVGSFVSDHAGDIKSAAQQAAGYVAGPAGSKLAGTAFDAAFGDPNAKKAIANAAAQGHPALGHAIDAVNKAVIASTMNHAVAKAAAGDPSAKVALAKVSIAASCPGAHPDVQFAASVANTAAGKVATTRQNAVGNPLALMASWG